MRVDLRIEERAGLDHARLEHLFRELGHSGADKVVSRAMEELAVRLAKVDRALARGELAEVSRIAASIKPIAEQIGMSDFARVAGNVADLARTRDSAALAACAARLGRLGESSLMAVWDIQDLSV